MSSRADLFSPTRAFALIASLITLFVCVGCYDAHPCGSEEVCNFADDDCDGLIDEDFVDEQGRYTQAQHCGGCGIDCAMQLPTAMTTQCFVNEDALPMCVVSLCPEGSHRIGDTACAQDIPALCLACSEDADCALREPGAKCLGAEGEKRCGAPCESDADCPEGFDCDSQGQCVPVTGDCSCTSDTLGAELGCRISSPTGDECAGVIVCTETGLSECEAALVETCNTQDDDCDGDVDEDFRNDDGLYVSPLHCGECARPCAPPGPNMIATCSPDSSGDFGVRCDAECAENFVDVDGLLANGCECERWTGEGPPPVVGGDIDCDGVVDDSDEFIFVTTSGNDTNPGTLTQPKRTIASAIAASSSSGKDVLVSRGVYDGFALVGGVSVFGGYSPDFRQRDLELYPVLLERAGAPGEPVVTCNGINASTRLEGVRVQASSPTRASEGSTAVYLNDCGNAVTLDSVTIFAARASGGTRGASSSDNLDDAGFTSLAQLDGVGGTRGEEGTTQGFTCTTVNAGRGGVKQCGTRNVSGGNGGNGACPDTRCEVGEACANAGCTDFSMGGVCDIDTVLSLAVANPAAQAGQGPSPGAAGEVSYNAPTTRGACNFCDDNPTINREGGEGGAGANGDDGNGGQGCTSDFAFDNATGRAHGGDGSNGAAGLDGSGGGGGTAGNGYAVIDGTASGCMDVAGGAGGGGGSGGCGAPRADGGTGGGYSIGIAVRVLNGNTAGPTLTNVRIITASGGDGGDGGIGASGGIGAAGANGGENRFWCARIGGRGGNGGRGGAGGGGGGGCGGDSHGVLVFTEGTSGSVSSYASALGTSVTVEAAGIAGRGGRGGFSPGNAGVPGADGRNQNIEVRSAMP